MAEPSGPGAGRRPAELTLQEMEKEARRLLRAADLEERKSAARAREVESLKAEMVLLRSQQAGIERDLAARPLDVEAMEKRVDALAGSLDRIKRGAEPPDRGGSLSARIAAAGLASPRDGEGADLLPDDDAARAGGGNAAGAPGGRRPTPVPAPPPVLLRPRFRPPTARPAELVRIELEAPGFADGTEVVLELWDRARSVSLGETNAFVDAEAVHAEIVIPLAAASTGGLVVHARAARAEAWSPPLDVTDT